MTVKRLWASALVASSLVIGFSMVGCGGSDGTPFVYDPQTSKQIEMWPDSHFTIADSTTATQQQLKDLKIADEQYERLELAFKLIVSKIGDRCIELNEALKEHARTNDTTAYEKARDNYVALIQNLNIHDPDGGQIDPENGLGYGNVLGWTIADVVVNYDRTHKMNLITGVTIVGEWIGYHTSSSGVPIPDKP